jgi:hypothetical protein
MPRYKANPLSLVDIQQDGPPLRLRDLGAIVGLSRATLIARIECGDLPAFRYLAKAGSPWYVQRVEARRWLGALGFE